MKEEDREIMWLLGKWSESRSVMSNSLPPHGLYRPWSSPGLNTGIIAQACGGAARTKCKLQNKRNLCFSSAHIFSKALCKLSKTLIWRLWHPTRMNEFLTHRRFLMHSGWRGMIWLGSLITMQIGAESFCSSPRKPTHLLWIPDCVDINTSRVSTKLEKPTHGAL